MHSKGSRVEEEMWLQWRHSPLSTLYITCHTWLQLVLFYNATMNKRLTIVTHGGRLLTWVRHHKLCFQALKAQTDDCCNKIMTKIWCAHKANKKQYEKMNISKMLLGLQNYISWLYAIFSIIVMYWGNCCHFKWKFVGLYVIKNCQN